MDNNRAEVRDFLITRRARITPEQAGLHPHGTRRVAGLRRGEVADLAGVSVEYYSKLERGDLAGVSSAVLDAIAAALQLEDAEREHLFDLARAATGTSLLTTRARRRPSRPWQPTPALQWTLDAIRDAPAAVGNQRGDLLAANHLGRALYSELYNDPTGRPNFSRFTFLDPAARRFYADWDYFADITVAMLRTEAGRNPHDSELHELVGELSTRSEEFRSRWSAHDVRIHTTGTKHYHHPVVGDLQLAYQTLDLAGEPGIAMTVYTAEPGSPTHQALQLLASWAATTAPAPTDTSPATRVDPTAGQSLQLD
ncbi:MAG: helix-turn-helix transcriptional regulator [Propionicimonas sp.]|uniref:helix-turn-helix transcriptional regulator n=1 Tax=Propionicimonas sp. TaxID=1955623 RepID=UPI003D10EBFD